MKKYFAEFLGTMILVIIGCGTAMIVGCDALIGCGYLLTALAFGVSFIVSFYIVGNISGCHINPAVSFAFWFNGKLSLKEFVFYVISQILGSFIGSLILWVVFSSGKVTDATACYGSNTLKGVSNSWSSGLLVEVLISFVFVLIVLFVSDEKSKTGSLSGVIIGIALTGAHILGIGLTGTGVNPARSIGPALIAFLFSGNFEPIKCLWIFIAGPLAGGVLASVTHLFLNKE